MALEQALPRYIGAAEVCGEAVERFDRQRANAAHLEIQKKPGGKGGEKAGVLRICFKGNADMEHPAVRSRKKLDKVYVLMSRQTRARLKLIAGFKSMQLFDLLDTLCSDFIQGWEKHTKVDLDKLQCAETKRQSRSTAKASRAKA